MKAKNLDDWAAFLDREITTLRAQSAPTAATFAMLDTSYAQLRAASSELKAQSAEIERAMIEGEQARRRVDALFDLATDAILETDEAAVVLAGNHSAARLLNVRLDYLRNKPLVLFVAEHDRPLLQNFLRPATGDQRVIRQDLAIQPRDGPPIQTVVAATRIEGISGEAARIMWLIRDAAGLATDMQAWRTTRDRLSREVGARESIVKDLDQSIGDRLVGIRKLSRRVMELQDFEGQKLARELKERFGQTLGAVKLNLESLAKAHAELRSAPLHREALKLVDAALQRLREIYFELSPPLGHGVGLSGMIRQLLARIPEPERLKASLEADALPLISPQVESAALWVAREAINNVVRHSGASALEVRIQREGSRLVMVVRDNGRGFNVAATRAMAERAGCFGLVGMEERVAILGGDIQIISAPRRGTEVRVMFPAAARE